MQISGFTSLLYVSPIQQFSVMRLSGMFSCSLLQLLMTGWYAKFAARTVFSHRTLSSRPRDDPTDHRGVKSQRQRDQNTQHGAARRMPEMCYNNTQSASKNHSSPHPDVARPLTGSPITQKVPRFTLFPVPLINHQSSSAEVLAQRLIGTCT